MDQGQKQVMAVNDMQPHTIIPARNPLREYTSTLEPPSVKILKNSCVEGHVAGIPSKPLQIGNQINYRHMDTQTWETFFLISDYMLLHLRKHV